MSDTTPITPRRRVPARRRLAIAVVTGALALTAAWAAAVVAQRPPADMDVAVNDGTSNT
jgi:hypothetical protein